MKVKPLGDRVLLKRVEAEEEVRGGIIIPDTAKEKPQEAEVVSVGDGKMDDDGKRKLQMDAKLRTWLIEPDGTKTEISCREICEQFNGNIVMQLRSGIDAGGDISTVELN